MNRLIWGMLVIFTLTGCNESGTTAQLKKIYGKKLSLEVLAAPSNCPKIIVYYGDQECSMCRLNLIPQWDLIIAHLDTLTPAIPVYFIITPPKEELQSVALYIDELKRTHYNITIDSMNHFSRQNKIIPKDSQLHTFLIDKDNRIVLVGNPLNNEPMLSLFRSTLDNMLVHDGIYVSEQVH